MTKGLTGIPSLAYLGVNAPQPPNITAHNRAPIPNDWQNFILGDLWLNTLPTPLTSRELWILVALQQHSATWIKLSPGNAGTVVGNVCDTGPDVTPNILGFIGIFGSTNINTAGFSTHLLQVNLNTSIIQPPTSADGTQGVYALGSTNYTTDRFLHGYGQENTFVGYQSGNLTLAPVGPGQEANLNTGCGSYSLTSLTSGDSNFAGGSNCFKTCTTGTNNVGAGTNAGYSTTTGSYNCFIGSAAAYHDVAGVYTGSYNTLLGSNDLSTTWTGAESSNIYIGSNVQNTAAVGESNVLRIGNAAGVGNGNITSAYIANVYSNYGTNNTFVGSGSGNFTLTVANAERNTALGSNTLAALTTGTGNSAGGASSLLLCSTGSYNTAFGGNCMGSCSGGGYNTAYGYDAGYSISTGTYNTSIGIGTMQEPTNSLTGSYNTVIGSYTSLAGINWTGAESSNIYIGHGVTGVVGDSNILRIGVGTGTGNGQVNKSFIAGIRGITTVNANAIAVLIDSAGQLGTVSSSIRHKENVKDISDISDIVSKLRPVEFNYKQHKSTDIQYGLIAEEVAEIWPEMLVYDKEGQPETVKYQYLPIILLKEIQNLRKRIEELENNQK